MSGGNFKELFKRVKVGRPPAFETPEQLLALAEEYFQFVDDNPMIECKGVGYQGDYELQEIEKPIPYTIQGLCTWCNCTTMTISDYRKKPTFAYIIKVIEEHIYNQKFLGASAGLFNANIIARDLGLKDKTDITSNDEPIVLSQDNDLELARKIAFGLRAAKEGMEKTPEVDMEEKD